MYDDADAIAVARVTFKNQGILKLEEDTSVLASQTLRDVYHPIGGWPKLSFTKVSLG
jgi:ABC-type transport system involved in Fe-S cluster assembly fused permease/ATPase subunit